MKDYTLVIHGTGHTKTEVSSPQDVEELMGKFLQDLKANGHVVEVATITHGDCQVLEA